MRIVPFRDAHPAGTADDDVRSNANVPMAITPVVSSRPRGRSVLDLLMMEKMVLIYAISHESNAPLPAGERRLGLVEAAGLGLRNGYPH